MAQSTFTAEASKACASFSKGLSHEKFVSIEFHLTGTPILVSPHLLRSRSMGQIDLVRYNRQRIEVCELKSSAHKFVSHKQRQRLKDSAEFLCQIFQVSSILCVR